MTRRIHPGATRATSSLRRAIARSAILTIDGDSNPVSLDRVGEIHRPKLNSITKDRERL
jgi:hypothetical protein